MARRSTVVKPSNRRKAKLVFATGIAVLGGGLGYSLVTAAIASGPPPSAGAVLASPPSSSSAAPKGQKSHPPDPDAGLSDSQIQARQKQAGLDFDQHYKTWRTGLGLDNISLAAPTIDLHSLPRRGMAVQMAPGQPSLHDAVAQADVIVVGTISAVQPSLMATSTTISVDQTLKGPSASNVVVMQSGGVRPTQGWASSTIVQGADGPLLLPGDRAVLFLWKTDSGYAIQSMSGWYQVVGGVVHPAPGNSWGALVDGKAEADFVKLVTAALK